MKKVGLWIDHKKAIIVKAVKSGAEIESVESGIGAADRHGGRAGVKSLAAPLAEDHRDRRLAEHLNRYYDEVMAHLNGADAIVIFGPGEAKLELEKRLAHGELHRHVVGIQAADKMTDAQLRAKVLSFFAV